MALHIIRTSNGNFFAEAEDPAQALRIMGWTGIDLRGAICDPFQPEFGTPKKVYTVDDATLPILGGTYTLLVKDEKAYNRVVTCRLGALWTDIYQTAKNMYGEENISCEFHMDEQ